MPKARSKRSAVIDVKTEPSGENLTVKIPTQIVRATDAESTRYAISAVQVAVNRDGAAWCTATNGKMLACHPCEVSNHPGPGRFLVPNEVLPRLRSHFRRSIHRISDRWFSQWNLWGTTPEGKFPKCEDVIESVDESETIVVGIDVKLLQQLVTAMGGRDHVTLLISSKDCHVSQQIGVISDDDENGFGVLMPYGGEGMAAESIKAFNRRVADFKQVASGK